MIRWRPNLHPHSHPYTRSRSWQILDLGEVKEAQDKEDAAAKIQTVVRGNTARKALRAIKDHVNEEVSARRLALEAELEAASEAEQVSMGQLDPMAALESEPMARAEHTTTPSPKVLR